MNQLLPKTTVKGLRKKRAIRRRRQEIITSVKITRTLYKQIQELAKRMDRTQSWIMREAVTSYVTFHSAKVKHEEVQSLYDKDEILNQ
jgi:predicted DNA-binding protein